VAKQVSLAQSVKAVLVASAASLAQLASAASAVPTEPMAHPVMAEPVDKPVIQVPEEPVPPRFHLSLSQVPLESPERLRFPAWVVLAVSQEPRLQAQEPLARLAIQAIQELPARPELLVNLACLVTPD
jgi:hypothetical protein